MITCPDCHGAGSVPASGWEDPADVDNGAVRCPTCKGAGAAMRSTFTTPYGQHKDREGQPFELVRVIDAPDATHDAEVLPMYVVRFADGLEVEAWPEEVEAAR